MILFYKVNARDRIRVPAHQINKTIDIEHDVFHSSSYYKFGHFFEHDNLRYGLKIENERSLFHFDIYLGNPSFQLRKKANKRKQFIGRKEVAANTMQVMQYEYDCKIHCILPNKRTCLTKRASPDFRLYFRNY